MHGSAASQWRSYRHPQRPPSWPVQGGGHCCRRKIRALCDAFAGDARQLNTTPNVGAEVDRGRFGAASRRLIIASDPYDTVNGGVRLGCRTLVAAEGIKNLSGHLSLTILVVDDEQVALLRAATILRHAGYRVIVARCGADAIVALCDNPEVALLFTDIKMPKIDGFMLADMAKFRRPDLKVLYTTGFADEVSTQPGLRYGKILEKPYEPKHLSDEVRLLLKSPMLEPVARDRLTERYSGEHAPNELS